MSNLQIILGGVLAVALAWLYMRQLRRKAADSRKAADILFSEVLPLLENAELRPGNSAGSWKVTGHFAGEFFQFTSVTDTLAVRKLPSLWLLVTLPKPQPLPASIDVMRRAAGPTTFSNFDFLPHRLATPQGFPEDAIVKTDGTEVTLPTQALALAQPILGGRQGKEVLLSPKGLRIVVQIAEADRVRYGVFREARFEGAKIATDQAMDIMNTLLAMDRNLAGKNG